MYSLLILLTLLGGYCFLGLLSDSKQSESRSRTWLLSLGLVIVNVAAIYTHFYAFFVMAAEMAFLAMWWFLRCMGEQQQGRYN